MAEEVVQVNKADLERMIELNKELRKDVLTLVRGMKQVGMLLGPDANTGKAISALMNNPEPFLAAVESMDPVIRKYENAVTNG